MATKFEERIIEISGQGIHKEGMVPDARRFASSWLETGIRRSSRMRTAMVSRKVGRPEKLLNQLCEVIEGGYSNPREGKTGLVYYVARIKDAAPELLRQPSLFGENFDPEDTALDFLSDSLSDVRAENRDSERFDFDLLEDFGRLSVAPKSGVSEFVIAGRSSVAKVVADVALGHIAKSLLRDTPRTQRIKVMGFLDEARFSKSGFELVVGESKQPIKAVLDGGDAAELGEFFGKNVLVTGEILYRPNGNPLILSAEQVRLATSTDSVFGEIGEASPRGIPSLTKPRKQRPLKLSELGGTWPGDETDEEILEMLKDIA